MSATITVATPSDNSNSKQLAVFSFTILYWLICAHHNLKPYFDKRPRVTPKDPKKQVAYPQHHERFQPTTGTKHQKQERFCRLAFSTRLMNEEEEKTICILVILIPIMLKMFASVHAFFFLLRQVFCHRQWNSHGSNDPWPGFHLHGILLSGFFILTLTPLVEDDTAWNVHWYLVFRWCILLSVAQKVLHAIVSALPLLRALYSWTWSMIQKAREERASCKCKCRKAGPFWEKGKTIPQKRDAVCIICLEGCSSGTKSTSCPDLGPLEAFCTRAPTKHPMHRSCFKSWKVSYLANRREEARHMLPERLRNYFDDDDALARIIAEMTNDDILDTVRATGKDKNIGKRTTHHPPCPYCKSGIELIIYTKVATIHEPTLKERYLAWMKKVWLLSEPQTVMEETLAAMAIAVSIFYIIFDPFAVAVLMVAISVVVWPILRISILFPNTFHL